VPAEILVAILSSGWYTGGEDAGSARKDPDSGHVDGFAEKADSMSILGLSAPEPLQPRLVGAGFWIRALARFIDTIIGYVVGHFAGYAAGIVLVGLQLLTFVRPGWPLRILHDKAPLILFSLVGDILYHTFCEGLYGATLGKFFCGLRVLSDDRTPCRLWAGFIRSAAYVIDAIAFGLVAWLEMSKTDAEKRHGDNWAHTVVVRNSEVPQESKLSEFRLFAALAAGLCAWGVMVIAGIVVAAL
jgi:uncharacterized RDD family membrane protein YckC